MRRFEILNVAARRLRLDGERLRLFAREVNELIFAIRQPELERVASWAGRGLTAYDACYVALAEERNTAVVTADEGMLRVAGRFAVRLSEAAVR